MNKRVSRQRGVALALVLTLLAAMTVTIAGIVSISREDVSLTDLGQQSARAFYLGKGVARLAMYDRLNGPGNEEESAFGEERSREGVFRGRYVFEDATVLAEVIPATAFVSLSASNADTWITLLTGMGGMSEEEARVVLQNMRDQPVDKIAPVGDPMTFDFARQRQSGSARGMAYVERLLSVEGLSRAVYDRIRRSITPFSSLPKPDLALAPAELRAVFSVEEEGPMESEAGPAGSANYFCVDMDINFSASKRYQQRVWVESTDARRGAVKLLRVEAPVVSPGGSWG